jgi:NAD(P)-dependent dehydrogenase (short-subunit alcohol dehydrogenase family)
MLARYLAEQGWEVVIHVNRSVHEASVLVSDILQAGGRAHWVQGDLRVAQDRKRIIDQASQKACSPLQILINNAAVFESDQLSTLTEAHWDQLLDVNAKAPLFLSQLFVQQLGEHSGHIIQVLDQRVLHPTQHLLSYTMSQWALLGATHVLARSLAPRVRVNAVAPGLLLQSDHPMDRGFLKKQQNLPLDVPPTGQHLAQAIQFLLMTPSITGHVIPVDGGEHLALERVRRS